MGRVEAGRAGMVGREEEGRVAREVAEKRVEEDLYEKQTLDKPGSVGDDEDAVLADPHDAEGEEDVVEPFAKLVVERFFFHHRIEYCRQRFEAVLRDGRGLDIGRKPARERERDAAKQYAMCGHRSAPARRRRVGAPPGPPPPRCGS